MGRGRPPKPAETRLLEGNPGHRPIPEPVVMGGRPAEPPGPPDHLDEDASAWWREAIPVLHSVGILDTVDTAALEMAATAYSRFRQAKRVIDVDGVTSEGSMGQIREHPALAIERAAQQTYLRFAEQYALTPSARTRLGLAELHRKSLESEMLDQLGPTQFVAADAEEVK
jgi:P27 family predicted phage terminase small subunit